jgi:hypothetical protein
MALLVFVRVNLVTHERVLDFVLLPYTDTAEKCNKRGRSDYWINAEFRQIQPPIDTLPNVAQGFSY